MNRQMLIEIDANASPTKGCGWWLSSVETNLSTTGPFTGYLVNYSINQTQRRQRKQCGGNGLERRDRIDFYQARGDNDDKFVIEKSLAGNS